MPVHSARRMEPIRGFGIDAVARAAETASARWPVLRLENLDTNLPLPPEAIPVTRSALETPEANSWLPFTGDDALRAAVAELLAERTGHRYEPRTEIVITSGGMEGILDALLATVDPGDEVLLTDPTYAGLVNRVHLVGGEPRYAPFAVVDGEWRLERDALQAAVTRRTRALLLMSPSMPSGGTFDADDWTAVCDLCTDRDLLLILDAAMERLLFDDRAYVNPVRYDGMPERTLVVGSMSKEFRMIGWRVGWVAGPRPLIDDVGWTHVYNTTTPVGVARAAATAVLEATRTTSPRAWPSCTRAATSSSSCCPTGRSCGRVAAGRCCSTSPPSASSRRRPRAGSSSTARSPRRR